MYNSDKTYQVRTKQRNLVNHPVNLLDLYDEGVARDKLRKIELRKDAIMLLRVKQKYDLISQHFAKFRPRRGYKIPYIKTNNGVNLYEENPLDMDQYPEIYEINLEELHSIDIDKFSFLPNLLKLSIRFSNIVLVKEVNFANNDRYPSLIELNLHCNNLDNSCLEIIRHITTLKSLNLMGNFIKADICDISSLTNLEELNLSYNKIESYFVNLNMLKELKSNTNNILAVNQSSLNYNDRETNDKHFNETQKTFQKLQIYLKTNMQDFYHKISQLKRLKVLNISNNRIHFFDIDPFYIQQNNGFPNLRSIDLSNNLIEEEISILLVVNVPLLEHLDITNNPITLHKEAFDNIEYQIFKSKNILLTNNAVYRKIKSRYNVKDILNYPPQPYLVKKYKIEQKDKKSLMTFVKPELTTDDSKSSDEEEEKNKSIEKEENVELPPIGKLSVNPILMTRLDMVGKKKKNQTIQVKQENKPNK